MRTVPKHLSREREDLGTLPIPELLGRIFFPHLYSITQLRRLTPTSEDGTNLRAADYHGYHGRTGL